MKTQVIDLNKKSNNTFPALYKSKDGRIVIASSESGGTALVLGHSDHGLKVGDKWNDGEGRTWVDADYTRMDLPVTIKFDL